jgi:hypothetical protein
LFTTPKLLAGVHAVLAWSRTNRSIAKYQTLLSKKGVACERDKNRLSEHLWIADSAE